MLRKTASISLFFSQPPSPFLPMLLQKNIYSPNCILHLRNRHREPQSRPPKIPLYASEALSLSNHDTAPSGQVIVKPRFVMLRPRAFRQADEHAETMGGRKKRYVMFAQDGG